MTLKTLIVISGTVIASAVMALPVLAPGAFMSTGHDQAIMSGIEAPLARKGDRLRILDTPCTRGTPSAPCADIYGAASGPRPMVTIELRIGPATSVLIRLPRSEVASR